MRAQGALGQTSSMYAPQYAEPSNAAVRARARKRDEARDRWRARGSRSGKAGMRKRARGK
jgi:hypothetical protein